MRTIRNVKLEEMWKRSLPIFLYQLFNNSIIFTISVFLVFILVLFVYIVLNFVLHI